MAPCRLSPSRRAVVDVSFGDIFLSELMGTAMLILLGCGVVANAVLAKNKGFGGGFLMINFGWGFAVFAGVYVAYKSGAHLNPAVTLGTLAAGDETSAGVDDVLAYLLGEFVGAFIGAVLCWLAYRDHFDDPRASRRQAGHLLDRPGDPQHRLEPRHRDHRHLRAGLRDPARFGKTPRRRSARWRSPCSWSASVPPSVARPATPSTRLVTSGRVSRTPSCRSRARATATGATPGSRSSGPLIGGVLGRPRSPTSPAHA